MAHRLLSLWNRPARLDAYLCFYFYAHHTNTLLYCIAYLLAKITHGSSRGNVL